MYVRIYVRTYVRMYVCMYLCMVMYVCICMYVYVYVYVVWSGINKWDMKNTSHGIMYSLHDPGEGLLVNKTIYDYCTQVRSHVYTSMTLAQKFLYAHNPSIHTYIHIYIHISHGKPFTYVCI